MGDAVSVAVGGSGVALGGMGVSLGGIGVAVGAAVAVAVGDGLVAGVEVGGGVAVGAGAAAAQEVTNKTDIQTIKRRRVLFISSPLAFLQAYQWRCS